MPIVAAIPRFRRKRWIGAGLAGIGLVIFASPLPVSEFVSFLSFKVTPERAKIAHIVQYTRHGTQITIVGTVHWDHFDSTRYPVWELLSILQALHPALVLVEIRPEAIAAEHFGEGPVEMPFCLLAARNAGLAVGGIDDWSPDMEVREDRMADHLLARAANTRSTLVFTGFSHVKGLGSRIERAGYRRLGSSAEYRRALLEQPVIKEWPRGLIEAYHGAIRRAESGGSHHDNPEWIARRRRLLKVLSSPP